MPRRPMAFVLATILTGCASSASAPDDPVRRDLTPAVVIDVVDGDTVRVLMGGVEVPVRLIGIDTPETDGPFTQAECFGRAASRYTHEALDGRTVGLGFDVERTDRFDRTLAYLWLGDALFNEAIVRDGYAVVATFPPNVRYVERFLAAERTAREWGVGLWAACPQG